MLNRFASLTMSTSVLKALPGKLDIKRHSPNIPGFIQASMINIQGLLKASQAVFFKDFKLMKNTDLSVKIRLQKC